MESMPPKLNLGRSLLVPSVQELAKQNLTNIPDRYVRPQLESPVISAGEEVPVIDLQKLISGDAMDSEQQKLHSACQQWGFLQVINHGVTPLLLGDFKSEVNKLFKLPMEEKKKLWQQEDSFEGFGSTSIVSEDQKLDWCDKFGLMTLPPHIRKVDLFQKLPSKLRDIMEVYCKEMKSLAMIIISQLAKALRMDEKETSDLFSDGMQAMRMTYYPPCPEPDRAIGLSSHSDADALTILFQLNETEGLQVRKDDMWVPIKPLPNALIVNIGDMMEVMNHGVTPSLLEEFKREVIELFKLPMEEKKKLWQQEDSFEGFGSGFVVSEDQKLDWSDMFAIMTLPPHIRKMDLFHKLPSKLRGIIEAYSKEMKSVAMIILCQLGKALRMDEKEMRELFSDGVQSIRMNYYPPCPEPEKTIGFTPHSDADALTILLQLNETEGLQVRKDDIWVPIKPLPHAFIVNVGDMMEILSNGVYKSIEHRAVVNSNKERLSVATFYTFNLDSEVGPAHNLIGQHNPPIFQRVPVKKYLQDFFARKLDGKSYLDFMKVEMSDGES